MTQTHSGRKYPAPGWSPLEIAGAVGVWKFTPMPARKPPEPVTQPADDYTMADKIREELANGDGLDYAEDEEGFDPNDQ